MAMIKMISVEVAYAAPDKQKIIALQMPEGSTCLDAINQSGVLSIFPEIDSNSLKIGVFSKSRDLNAEVKEGERIEIYRPLTIDPKEARRRKARSQK